MRIAATPSMITPQFRVFPYTENVVSTFGCLLPRTVVYCLLILTAPSAEHPHDPHYKKRHVTLEMNKRVVGS
jgi:hypothetical protein